MPKVKIELHERDVLDSLFGLNECHAARVPANQPVSQPKLFFQLNTHTHAHSLLYQRLTGCC